MPETTAPVAPQTTIPAPVGAGVPPTPVPAESGNGKAAPVEAPKPDRTTSAAFAALAKKEKGILLRAQDQARKEQELKEREDRVAAYEKVKAEAKMKPLEALKELGLEYEDVTSFILNKEKPTADAQVMQLRKEIEQIRADGKAEREALEREKIAAAQQRNQETIVEFQREIVNFVEANKEKYDLIHIFGAGAAVYQGITDVYKQTGRIPTIEESAQGVQKFLEQKLDELIPKTKWFVAKYGPKQAETTVTPDGAVVASQTITNAMSPMTSSGLPAQTEKERVARALAALDKA